MSVCNTVRALGLPVKSNISMRVGVIAPEFPPSIGGMQRYAWNVVSQLIKRGHQVTVFTSGENGNSEHLEGASLRPVLTSTLDHDGSILDRYAAAIDVWHAMNAGYAGLSHTLRHMVVSIHGNDFLNPSVFFSRKRYSLLGSRISRHVNRIVTRTTLRRSFRQVSAVIANSNYTRNRFLDIYPECSQRTTVASVGVDNSWFTIQREERKNGEPWRLVTVCRLEDRRKNVNLVIRALADLAKVYPLEYTIVGDGHLRSELEHLVARLNLSKMVHFRGWLPDSDLRSVLARSDLFVLTASANARSIEGFGIAYLEANLAGTPTLAARLGGAVEAVEEGVSGFFVEDLSSDAIRVALRKFINGDIHFDSDDCRSFAANFTWDRVGNSIETVYARVVRREACSFSF